MKEVTGGTVTTELVDNYCEQLSEHLEQLHEEARSAETVNRRQRAAREAGKGPGMQFCIGDYVMVSATKNQANRQRRNKNMVRWQGPYEVVGFHSAPTELEVKLVGTADVKKVSWKKCRRIAGPDLQISQAVQNSALNDLQTFKVDYFVDWGFDDEGKVQLLVHWQGFDESERTWQPMQELWEDVKVMVDQYVAEEDNDDLTAARDSLAARANRNNRA